MNESVLGRMALDSSLFIDFGNWEVAGGNTAQSMQGACMRTEISYTVHGVVVMRIELLSLMFKGVHIQTLLYHYLLTVRPLSYLRHRLQNAP
jgi:hypothetical protein